MTEIELHRDTSLAVDSDQIAWNPSQRAALEHIGVENASDGDLEVFFHVCKRTGLDPFARQIHMIGRNTKNQRTNQWETKYTIQTGIDGFRLIGRRAADRSHDTISVNAPQWAHEDGSWRDVWSPKWGLPIAARVTLLRGGQSFTGVALFNEYKQTKRDGDLTSMWAQRPAGQLAKCAEALAWRMAFPQDLSGLYTDDEMGQADRPARPASGLGAALNQQTAAEHVPDEPAPMSPLLDPQSALAKRMHATFNELGVTDRDNRLAYASDVIGRPAETSNDLSEAEAAQIIDALEADREQPFPGVGE